MKTTKRIILTLVALIGMTGAWAQDATPEVTWNAATKTGTFTMPAYDVEVQIEYETELALNESTDNTDLLAEWNDYEANVTLTRSLQAGGWNTLAVPFTADAASIGLSAAKELVSAELENYELTLNFTDATVIEAGKPYLVKVADNVENPVFDGVIVSNALVPTETAVVDFVPTLGATNIAGDNAKEVLFLTADNKLLTPTALPADIKGFRAYFQLKDAAADVKTFKLNLGDDGATGIIAIEKSQVNAGTFDLLGRKVSGKLQTGVYIVNGKKEIIK